jgi:hypothetical protein
MINSGLGNQMFQYAIARRLSLALGADLILLLDDGFRHEAGRKYGLRHFAIAGVDSPLQTSGSDFAPAESARRGPSGAFSWFRPPPAAIEVLTEREVWDFIPQSGAPGFAETNDLLFRPDVLDWRGDVRLAGYWQDERYFADVDDVIRSDFTLTADLDDRSRATLSRIQSGPSAFIHVRRGDYLEPTYNKLFGVCEVDYYRRGLEILRSRVGDDLRIFVFSDGPDWVRQNQIGGADAEIIDWNGDAPARDIALMRACRHAVIANSSFSWWGAWLGEWPGRTVIAPRIWLKAVPEFQDPVPARWLRL